MKAHWAGYFQQLYQADPPTVKLNVRGVTIPIADPPVNCGPPSFGETQSGEPVQMGKSSWDLWYPC